MLGEPQAALTERPIRPSRWADPVVYAREALGLFTPYERAILRAAASGHPRMTASARRVQAELRDKIAAAIEKVAGGGDA